MSDYLSLHHTRIHYYRTGTGDGSLPPVVLAHGFSDNGQCWLPAVRPLSRDYDLILPDARGHGHSQRVVPGKRVDLPGDLAKFIRSLGLEQPVLGGHSMGASTAARAAVRFPGLARALILEDPAWIKQQGQRGLRPYDQWLLSVQNLTLEEIIAKGKADNPLWPEAEWIPWAASKQQFDANFFQTQRSAVDWKEVVKNIDCPTLLLTADPARGGIVTPDMAQASVCLNERVQVVHFPNTGHNIRREDHRGFVKAVREFLREVTCR